MTTPQPTPVAPEGIQRFGAGVFQLGETGALVNASSLINGLRLEPSTEVSDSSTKLSGWVRSGKATTTWSLAGNIDTDAARADGVWQLAYDMAGEAVDFTFTPESATGVTVTGEVTITPLRLGSDEYGDDLTSDFEWSVIGTPQITRTP